MKGQNSQAAVVAIDLGATSGRVMLGQIREGRVELEQIHRFGNGPVPLTALEPGAAADALAWDVDALWAEILKGLERAFARSPEICSIGVDSWAVDYALLAEGRRLGQVRHYRDPRNVRAVPELERRFGRAELFERNGLQFLPFNTIYQLQAEAEEERLQGAETLLLVPDYINWLLSGQVRCEWTNASTTGLLDPRTGSWDQELAHHLGVGSKLAPIVHPGEVIGKLRPELAKRLGASGPVTIRAVASHDTASAVAAVPLASRRCAYVSCGTWGLVGVELEHPVLGIEARDGGFTNELGIDGTVRFLKNVTGTFLLSESLAFWNGAARRAGREGFELASLLERAAALRPEPVRIDPQDPRFLAPGDVPVRIAQAVAEAGGGEVSSPERIIRIIIESLAGCFAEQARAAAALGGFELQGIHVVGGGSQGELLCQLTADEAGVPVSAGPVECTALGNVLLQLRAASGQEWAPGRLRELVDASVDQRHYQPRPVRPA